MDDFHDPVTGVLNQGDYEALSDADKGTWKGYMYVLSEWSWDADKYEDQDEPDDWGDQTEYGPLLTLDRVLAAFTAFKWDAWLDSESDSFQSKVKKGAKKVIQIVARIERADGKPLSHDEREHIETKLKLK